MRKLYINEFRQHSLGKVNYLILPGSIDIKANTFGIMKRLFKVLLFPKEKSKNALVVDFIKNYAWLKQLLYNYFFIMHFLSNFHSNDI